jgi:hypothetical protein
VVAAAVAVAVVTAAAEEANTNPAQKLSGITRPSGSFRFRRLSLAYSVTGCHENLCNTARQGRNQTHDTEETVEAEDLGFVSQGKIRRSRGDSCG